MGECIACGSSADTFRFNSLGMQLCPDCFYDMIEPEFKATYVSLDRASLTPLYFRQRVLRNSSLLQHAPNGQMIFDLLDDLSDEYKIPHCDTCESERYFYFEDGTRICPDCLRTQLKSLYGEMGIIVDSDDRSIHFVAPASITYHDREYDFSDWDYEFNIYDEFALDTLDNTQLDITSDPDSMHPHTSSDGYCCAGSNHYLLLWAFKEHNWSRLGALILVTPGIYTPDSCYNTLCIPCEVCYDSDAEYVCSNCGKEVCRDCFSWETTLCIDCGVRCCECGGIYYEEETKICEECGDTVCIHCAVEVEQEPGEDDDEETVTTRTLCPYCAGRTHRRASW